MHFWVTLNPGKFSCFWRVNCENDNVVYSVAAGERIPIQNPYNTTVMPLSYRWTLIIIMITNAAINMLWDYAVVNGIRKKLAAKKRQKQVQLIPAKNDEDGNVAETV